MFPQLFQEEELLLHIFGRKESQIRLSVMRIKRNLVVWTVLVVVPYVWNEM